LQRVVNRCLEKNPEQRFHSASDLAFALDALSDSGASSAVAKQTVSDRSPRRVLAWSIVLIAVILLVTAWFEIANRNTALPLRVSEYTQLTHNGHAGYVVGTDGSRLYLSIPRIGGSISQVSASGGEIGPVPFISVPIPSLLDVSPDGSTLLVTSYEKGATDSPPLYTVQVVGGSHRYLADAESAAWSPDGKLVTYSTPNGDLNVINSDGTGVHKLASVGGIAYEISWSPDGRTIRFLRDNSLWEITSGGSNLHPLLTSWHPSEGKCCGRWSPGGDFFAFLGPGPAGPDSQIYALDERRGFFRRPTNEPFQLTSGPISWDPPVFSKDGKKLFATGATDAGELMRLDTKSNEFQPFLGGISADLVAFSKDGQSIAYASYPDDILWRANRDGSDRLQLTSPPLQPRSVVWSPDGTQLAFMAQSPQGARAWIVSSSGGSPQRLLPEDGGQETDPNWSPDGRKIVFATGLLKSRESHIRILDLASHQVTTLPGSEGMFAPRWSPDGQSILGHSFDASTLYIFDIKTQHWSTLYRVLHAYGSWSRDSRSVYVLRFADNPAILRIPVTGGEPNVVVGLKGFPYTGTNGLWLGLDPADAPLMLRDVSTTDVYALTLEEK
jgi:eukaryotic-like serine/threonine-protein kinase